MEFFARTYRQALELLRSMSPAMRVTTAVLLLAVVVSAGALWRWPTASPDTYLFGGNVLSDREIARLEAAFSKAGLNDWEATGNRIKVPRSKRFNYIAAAAEEGVLPEDLDTILAEMIKNSSPFETRELREMRYKYAQQREMSKIIEAMSGIERASVKFAETSSGGLRRDAKKTAVVAVQPEQNRPLSREQVETIRATAASGLGIPVENVVVTDLRGVAYAVRSVPGNPGIADNLYAEHKKMYEQLYQQKIAESLSMIPGVLVGVNVELDTRINQTTQTKTYSQPQPVRSSNSSVKTTSRSDGGGGRVGAVPNGALGNRAEEVAATSTSASESTTSETHEQSESIVGQESTDIVHAGLTPTTVTATVQIPQSYFRRIWLERNPPKPGAQPAEPDPGELRRIETEEINRITESVQHLIPGLAPGKDPYPRVFVTSFVDTVEPPPPAPGIGETVTTWLLENWRLLLLSTLAVLALVWVRSLVKSASVAAAPLSVPQPVLDAVRQTASSPPPQGAAAAEERRLKKRAAQTGPSLRDELAELVREDPDSAAAVLSSWIGEAT